MPFWKRLWLLFSAIWVFVALLNVLTIVLFAEANAWATAALPLLSAFVVPALLYGLGWGWSRWRGVGARRGSGEPGA